MKNCKRLIALLLALAMTLALAACGGETTPDPTEAPSVPATTEAPVAAGDVEELGSGDVKWSEEKTADGWIKVTNEGGMTLGYSPDSGVKLIQVDGYAFKDLDRDGALDVYEDWRVDYDTRAADLASQLTVDDMTPLFTHGGWNVSTTIDESNSDWDYIQAGGRGGVTRGSITEGTTTTAVLWTNALQSLCEATGNWGIPATISVDPNNISGTLDNVNVGMAFDTELAFELGVLQAKMYRAVGVTMLLGPQIDLIAPIFQRTSGTYSEDPALTRDLANAYISGLQSTWAEDGTDLGWGVDSVYAITKHFAGAGAGEGGRNDHGDDGKYNVFPGNNFEAHLIGYFDGAFNLDSSTGESGIMTNYSISYSRDGSLGELVAGAYSAFKVGLTDAAGYKGFIITDWGVAGEGQKCWGMEEYTEAEQFAAMLKIGIDQVGGSANYEAAAEGFEILCDEIGEEAATARLRDAAETFIRTQMYTSLYDNPYVSLEHATATVWNNETDKIAAEMQPKSIIMLKNTDGAISQYVEGSEKETVYVPYVFSPATEGNSSAAGTPASWNPAMDLAAVEKYYNVVTDTVGEPSGTDAEGNPAYTENDVIRASAADLAKCSKALVPIDQPFTGSSVLEDGTYTPASLQFEEYTATAARRESIAGDTISEIINDGYGTKTQVSQENRSYYGKTVARASNYADYEMLQMVAAAVPADCDVILLVNGCGSMIWSEVEPLSDAILYYYGTAFMGGTWWKTESVLEIVSGKVEPTGLLNMQQPINMEVVETQYEDVPRDMECYVDANGNTYDFAFGMNWSGIINDERVAKYSVAPLTECETYDYQPAK